MTSVMASKSSKRRSDGFNRVSIVFCFGVGSSSSFLYWGVLLGWSSRAISVRPKGDLMAMARPNMDVPQPQARSASGIPKGDPRSCTSNFLVMDGGSQARAVSQSLNKHSFCHHQRRGLAPPWESHRPRWQSACLTTLQLLRWTQP